MHRDDPCRATHTDPRLWWIGMLAFVSAVGGWINPLVAGEAIKPEDRFRGGKVEWARLRHHGEYWNRHASSDGVLLAFIRANTTLDIDSVWRQAPAEDLAAMAEFPFLFADTLQFTTASERRNLAEYLRRGGFVLIDACCNGTINPDPKRFLDDHLRILRDMFPNLQVEELSSGHEVFSIYFQMTAYPPQTWSPSWSGGSTNPLRLLRDGDRPIGMLSISALQCGWAQVEGASPVPAMTMVTNIYLYAITR